MTTLYAISLLTFSAYITFVLLKFGTPNSLSASYYHLEKRGWLFQVALAVSAFTLLPLTLELSKENIQFMSFLMCGGSIFVAFAPKFKESLEGGVHKYAALVSGVMSLLWVGLMGYAPLIFISLFVGFSLYAKYGKPVFWAEMACFMSAYAVCLIELIKI